MILRFLWGLVIDVIGLAMVNVCARRECLRVRRLIVVTDLLLPIPTRAVVRPRKTGLLG